MQVSDDFGNGFMLGATIVLAIWVFLSLLSCGSPDLYDYPEEEKQCVVRFRMIEECYPKDQTE